MLPGSDPQPAPDTLAALAAASQMAICLFLILLASRFLCVQFAMR
jgi:hypothetical protein